MELLEALNACNDVKIYSVEDAEFSSFGRIIKGYDFEELETYMNLTSQIPEDGNVYVASVEGRSRLVIVMVEIRHTMALNIIKAVRSISRSRILCWS